MSSGAPAVSDSSGVGLSTATRKRDEEKPHNGGNNTYDGPESLAGHETARKHPDALHHPDASSDQGEDSKGKENDPTGRHVPHASPEMPP